MSDKNFDELLMELRDSYNQPPETPREEMWAAIQARLDEDGREKGTVPREAVSQGGVLREAASEGVAPEEAASEGVVSLENARRSRWARIPATVRWSMAAAALLVLGLGIGRMTAPGTTPRVAEGDFGAMSPDPQILRTASVEHLGRTESLLTLLRADARSGRVESTVGDWAKQLLSQTRLLMDAQPASDPVMEELLKDLELVLIQIVGVANTPPEDRARVRSELNLALEGLEEREVLPRIQAVVPAGPGRFGT